MVLNKKIQQLTALVAFSALYVSGICGSNTSLLPAPEVLNAAVSEAKRELHSEVVLGDAIRYYDQISCNSIKKSDLSNLSNLNNPGRIEPYHGVPYSQWDRLNR